MLTHNQLNCGLLIVGTLTAVGTIGLAFATFWMAKKTRDLAVQEERHHQYGAMPVCVLETLGDGGGGVKDRKQIIELSEDPKFVSTPVRHFLYKIKGILKNIGTGPALKLRVTLCFPSDNSYKISYPLSPLGVNETRDPAKIGSSALWGVFITLEYGATSDSEVSTINSTFSKGWCLYLEYEDVFGNPYHTRHSTNTNDAWGTFVKGAAPYYCPETPKNIAALFRLIRKLFAKLTC